ncbi:hypothetical protein WICPIJ_002875 [Wickerhamomyces pijperi]|uniref:Uncharacterized protein n=1 Tax=Wickerhamomyces pijperi TaxID=599730 RepID=A0A9P8TPE4_WICPI|nr:hypothetical protein WICPIJ_002875 [Wickerhamomyces pijperi]
MKEQTLSELTFFNFFKILERVLNGSKTSDEMFNSTMLYSSSFSPVNPRSKISKMVVCKLFIPETGILLWRIDNKFDEDVPNSLQNHHTILLKLSLALVIGLQWNLRFQKSLNHRFESNTPIEMISMGIDNSEKSLNSTVTDLCTWIPTDIDQRLQKIRP